MDATLKVKVEQLANEIATEAKSLNDVNGLFRTLMKSALGRMLDSEMDVHLGRREGMTPPTNTNPLVATHDPRTGATDARAKP